MTLVLLITIAGGQTIHSFAGIGLGTADTKTLINKVSKSTIHKERWMRTKVLVVDEISMLDKHVFEVLDQIARQLKELDEPFGGMQVLVVGDFMQLPPVNKDRRNRSEFCFESPVWKEAGLNDVKGRVTVVMMVMVMMMMMMMLMCTSSICIVYLKKIERQKDEEFVTLLNQVRLGETSHTLMVVMMMMIMMIMMMVVVMMMMIMVVMMMIMVVVIMMMMVIMMIVMISSDDSDDK
jgi:ATP-dependent DNA helicase PIF1